MNDTYLPNTANRKTLDLGDMQRHVTTVPYEQTFLLFDSKDTVFYKYDRAEEEFLPMPRRMSQQGTPLLVSLDIFPKTIHTALPGKIAFVVFL